jgi:pantetheine-phosphate adenylyltransferase
MRHAIIGGTFDNLHKGHKEFIKRAFEIGDKVVVCITADEMVKRKPLARMINPYEKRRRVLINFLKEQNWLKKAEIIEISDPFSEGLRPELTDIVVSSETMKNAEKINEMRKNRGLKKLRITEIKWISSSDGKPISDVRIRMGEIDRDGNLL